MIKIINKKSIIAIIAIGLLLLLLESKSFAIGGQAKDPDNSLTSKTISEFFEIIRAMETSTGTLGKSSSINTNTDYLDTSGNGIDCHMIKNTEYGTLSILAASEYGNKNSQNNVIKTANNNTGIYIPTSSNYNNECVASTLQLSEDEAIVKNSYNEALVRADDRYKNKYVRTEKYGICGDGIIETDSWYDSNVTFPTQQFPHINRRYMFTYARFSGGSAKGIYARAAVVCGPGL